MKKAKQTKIERMLHKLFPDACATGLRVIRRQRGKSLSAAWKSATVQRRSEVLMAANVSTPRGLECRLCGRKCWVEARNSGKLQTLALPKRLRDLYAKA